MLRNHDLHHEFPKMEQQIHELKMNDSHFRKLFDDYHEINDEIHRIETGAEATTDEVLTDLRKRRLLLKDELGQMLAEVK